MRIVLGASLGVLYVAAIVFVALVFFSTGGLPPEIMAARDAVVTWYDHKTCDTYGCWRSHQR